ncbi:hypothetical protein [Neobacillus muris]|uniref:hypothetical protein n=1 Tax=Neobacillus muris TaxID=2941334 RepID=UPI00204194E6|nr:hypothetical protein [Neobacillus muris]
MEKNTAIEKKDELTTKTDSDNVMKMEEKKAKIFDRVESGIYFYQCLVPLTMTNLYYAGKRFGSLDEFLDYFVSLMKVEDNAKWIEQLFINQFGEWLELYWQEFYAPFRQDEVGTSVKERILTEASEWSRRMADEFSLFVFEDRKGV